MNRFIRNSATGYFLSPQGSWVKDYAEARNFSDVMALITAACELNTLNSLEEVVMVGKRPSFLDFHLPLLPDSASPGVSGLVR